MAVTIEALVKLDTREAIAARETVADLEKTLRNIAAKKYSAKMEIAGADIAAKNLAYLTSSAAKFDAEIKDAEAAAKRFSSALQSQMQNAQATQKAQAGLASSMNGIDKKIQEAEAASKAFSDQLRKQMEEEEATRVATDGLLSSMNAYDQAIYLNEQRGKSFSDQLRKQMEAEEENARAAEQNTTAHNALAVALGNIAARAFHLVISKITQSLREAVSTMKDVDTQLTNISKVSGITGQALADMGERAYETASKYGVSADEYLSAVYTFQKAGLGDSAEKMGELAVKTMLVGDTTADVASQFLISSNAAWKFGGDIEKLNELVDEADYINNNYATDLQKLSEGLPRVASVAAQAGMSAEETLAALGTITAVTQESGTKAATALRALILNIEGQVGEFVDETGESFSVTEESVKSMQGLMEKYAKAELEAARASGELINPMTAIKAIFEGMASSDLNNQELFQLLSGMGGKLRTNQLTALVQNYELFDDMLNKIADSAGTADGEIALMMESWERKTQVLKNTWTEFVSDLVDTSLLKGAIDRLTGVVELLDTFTEFVKNPFFDSQQTQAEIDDLQAEYDSLIAKGSEITGLEKVRLEYLEKQLEVLNLQQEAEAKSEAKRLQGDLTRVDTMTGMRKDEYNLALLNEQSAQVQFYGDIEGYRDALKEINVEWSKYYSNILAVKEAGIELTESQEQFIQLYEDNQLASTAVDVQEELVNGYHVLVDEQGKVVAYEKDRTAELETQKQKWEGTVEKEQDATTEIDSAKASLEQANYAAEQFAKWFSTAADNIGRIQMGLNGLNFPSFGFASGTKNAPGGPTLVNELGPELISENGRAYIANGGAPAVVNLSQGAIVLTADETKTALKGGMPIHAAVRGQNTSDFAGAVSEIVGTVQSVTLKGKSKKEVTATIQGAPGAVASAVAAISNATGRSDFTSSRGGGGTGGSGGSSAAPAKSLEEIEKDFSDLLSNLDKQAKLANNQRNYEKEAQLYSQAQDAIKGMVDEYRKAGYKDDSNEILDLLNKNYDYANKQTNALLTAGKKQIDVINAEAELAKDAGDFAEAARLYGESQSAIADLIEIYRSAGYAENSKEILDLQKRRNDYLQKQTDMEEQQLKTEIAGYNDILKNLDLQAQIAEREGNYEKQAQLYEKAQEVVKQMQDAYKRGGYADDSDEVLRTLQLNYQYADKQLSIYTGLWDDLIGSLEASTNAQELANTLEEKKQAVTDAQEALENAQRQRTTRVFNAETGQWEWVANQNAVKSAQKSLETAEKGYADEVRSQALAELRSMRDTITDLNDVVLGPALSAVVTMSQSSPEFQTFARALNAVFGVGSFLNSTEGSSKTISTADSHDTVYSFGNVTLTEEQASNMSVAELARMLNVLKLTS